MMADNQSVAYIAENSEPTAIDIAQAVDEGPWTAARRWVMFACAFAVLVDGFDNLIVGFAIPVLAREWQVSAQEFASVVAVGYLGMIIGTAVVGMISDRIGRRSALILSVLLFGLATAAAATSHSIPTFGFWKTMGGFGLGGALPCAAALIAESTPVRRRGFAVTVGIMCIPAGGIVGGLVASLVLPLYGWRGLFWIGGAAALCLACLLATTMPESARFLVRKGSRGPKLDQAIRTLGLTAPPNAVFVDTGEAAIAKGSIKELFVPTYRYDTVGLWVAFFACLTANYTVLAWTPSLFVNTGFNIQVGTGALTVYNVGGIFGAGVTALLVGRTGSRTGILSMLIAGAITAGILALVPFANAGVAVVMIGMFVVGIFINGVAVALYTLASQIYPTDIRATGVGAGSGVGRIGALVSSFAGALVMSAGTLSFFMMILVALFASAIAVALVRAHTPAIRSKNAAPAATGGARNTTALQVNR